MIKKTWNTFIWYSPRQYSLWYDYVSHNPMSWSDLLEVMELIIKDQQLDYGYKGNLMVVDVAINKDNGGNGNGKTKGKLRSSKANRRQD